MSAKNKAILVTGAAGFIGFHLVKQLLARGDKVIGIDNLNEYYDVALKEARINHFHSHPQFTFYKLDIINRTAINDLFSKYAFDVVVHLAAQAGVRYSLENPQAYIESNLLGFCNILEATRYHRLKNLIFASSSSVYGANTKQPFSEHHNTEHPLALYGATKKANELMAHSYAHLYQLPCTGLRFFTVYGPWGRPDMALFKFTKNILLGKPIEVYNQGQMMRDFTYVDDIVRGLIQVIDKPAQANPNWDSQTPDPASSNAPFRIYNIGNNQPVLLKDFITVLESALNRTAQKIYLPLQAGDVMSTYADVSSLEKDFDFRPKTSIQEGINSFVKWYRGYYRM